MKHRTEVSLELFFVQDVYIHAHTLPRGRRSMNWSVGSLTVDAAQATRFSTT